MDIRQNPLWLSFSVGRWFRTDVRVSIWFPLIILSLMLRQGWQLGLIVGGLLFTSILIHEFFHVIAARRTGGGGDEILLWPLGGLASVNPAPTFHSEVVTALAGPLANLLIGLACLPYAVGTGMLATSLHPLTLPTVDFNGDPIGSIVLLLLSLNSKLLLLNLLPIFPLDGGQVAYSIAKLTWDRQTARIGSLWLGMVLSLLLSLGGWIIDSANLLLLSFVLMMLSMHEFWSAQVSRQFDDSFMGYDFSQGYTSLEGPEEREDRRGPGPLARWKQERDARRKEKEEQQRLETERRVDELLDKVHQHGMASLTDAERRFLQRASNKYRSQG